MCERETKELKKHKEKELHSLHQNSISKKQQNVSHNAFMLRSSSSSSSSIMDEEILEEEIERNFRFIKKGDLDKGEIDIIEGTDYSKNKMISESDIFNLAGKTGVLLYRIDGGYKVLSLEIRNVLDMIFIESLNLVNLVATLGVSSCSFIVLTDDVRSFAIVSHLDASDNINQLLEVIIDLGFNPTFLFASIPTFKIPTPGEGSAPDLDENEFFTSELSEIVRVRTIIKKYNIKNIEILDRGRITHARENAHNIIGINLIDFSIFGTMGNDDNFERDLKVVLDKLKKIPSSLQSELSRFGLEDEEEKVFQIFQTINSPLKSKFTNRDKIISKGAELCLKDDTLFQQLFGELHPIIKPFPFRYGLKLLSTEE